MSTGKPSLKILQTWNASYTVLGLLLQLQFMLSDPDLTSPINPSAVDILSNAPRLYGQMIRDCVIASKRIAAGIIPQENATTLDGTIRLVDPSQSSEPLLEPKVQRVKISFESYYDTWKGLATTVPGAEITDAMLKRHLAMIEGDVRKKNNAKTDGRATVAVVPVESLQIDKSETMAPTAAKGFGEEVHIAILAEESIGDIPSMSEDRPKSAQEEFRFEEEIEDWEEEAESLLQWSKTIEDVESDERHSLQLATS